MTAPTVSTAPVPAPAAAAGGPPPPTTPPPAGPPPIGPPPAAPAAPPLAVVPGRDGLLATLSLVLGIAGLLPVLPLVGSVAAATCGAMALAGDEVGPGDRSRARAGLALGVLGIVAPLVALFVYCVVLGYPFPLHRYQPGG